jgi:hypothetical protein
MQGSKRKDWAEALRRALHRESGGKGSPIWLEVIANRVVELAAEGDMQAIKEVGDRMDGRPVQATALTDPEGNAMPGKFSIEFVSAASRGEG